MFLLVNYVTDRNNHGSLVSFSLSDLPDREILLETSLEKV